MVQIAETTPDLQVEKVEIVDLEDAAHLPPGHFCQGAQLGNMMWRSPESHADGRIWKPSDMVSFGIVVR